MSSPPAHEEHPVSTQPRWLVGLVRGLDLVASACMAVSGVMMVVLIAIFGWLVFGRYVLNDTPTWVEQASLVLVVWITFLGAAVGVWRSTHLSIDFIREGLPGLLRESLRILTDLLLAGFGLVMAWYGTNLAIGTSRRLIPMLGISEGWRALPLGLSGALIFVFALVSLFVRLNAPNRSDR